MSGPKSAVEDLRENSIQLEKLGGRTPVIDRAIIEIADQIKAVEVDVRATPLLNIFRLFQLDAKTASEARDIKEYSDQLFGMLYDQMMREFEQRKASDTPPAKPEPDAEWPLDKIIDEIVDSGHFKQWVGPCAIENYPYQRFAYIKKILKADIAAHGHKEGGE